MAPRPFKTWTAPEVSGLKSKAPVPPARLPDARPPETTAPAPKPTLAPASAVAPAPKPPAEPAAAARPTVPAEKSLFTRVKPADLAKRKGKKAADEVVAKKGPEGLAAGPVAIPDTGELGEEKPRTLAAELDETLAQIEELQATPFGRPRRARAEGEGRLLWVWEGVKDSLRNYRMLGRRLAAWWRYWRGTASCRVLLAFIAIYVLLALVRAPSEVVVEQSRRGEEIAFLQDFLRDYRAAGGTVLAEKPHGGTELYPRGVLLQGEVLAAFSRAPVGEVFTVRTTSPDSNLLSGFYGFPAIYLGGSYFHLERKFNFALYQCSYLIRKDSEQAGVILMARVEPAP